MMTHSHPAVLLTVTALCLAAQVFAYTPSTLFTARNSIAARSQSSALFAVAVPTKKPEEQKEDEEDPTKPGYVPKWTKKSTLADSLGGIGDLGFEKVGLKGDIPVVFQQGNQTRSTMAWQGQPYRDVATQAGQFVKYGCGKGDCGTCECMVNGKWIRPCVAKVPAQVNGPDGTPEQLLVTIKASKVQASSSGTFFSFRSFIMGFWNNLIGMLGFVKFIESAKKNWAERIEYEDLVRQRTKQIKQKRLQDEAAGQAKTA